MHKKYTLAVPAIAYAILIYYLSSLSSPPDIVSSGLFSSILKTIRESGVSVFAFPLYIAYRYPDKFAHVLLYFGFGFALYPATRYSVGRYPAAVALVIGTIYAASDEFHQNFIPGRDMSFSDFLADFTGIFISQMAIVVMLQFRKRFFSKKGFDKHGGVID